MNKEKKEKIVEIIIEELTYILSFPEEDGNILLNRGIECFIRNLFIKLLFLNGYLLEEDYKRLTDLTETQTISPLTKSLEEIYFLLKTPIKENATHE